MIVAYIIIFLSLVGYINNARNHRCINHSKQPLLSHYLDFLHHLVYFITFLGWLSNSKIILIIHVLITVSTYIGFLLNDGKCWMTQLFYDLCDDITPSKSRKFKSLPIALKMLERNASEPVIIILFLVAYPLVFHKLGIINLKLFRCLGVKKAT